MEGKNIVMILFSGVTEYSDRKVIILPRYSIPCSPLSNAVVVCYGRVHCRIQSWIPGSVLFRLTVLDRVCDGALGRAHVSDMQPAGGGPHGCMTSWESRGVCD
jgi:hypothetical protein